MAPGFAALPSHVGPPLSRWTWCRWPCAAGSSRFFVPAHSLSRCPSILHCGVSAINSTVHVAASHLSTVRHIFDSQLPRVLLPACLQIDAFQLPAVAHFTSCFVAPSCNGVAPAATVFLQPSLELPHSLCPGILHCGEPLFLFVTVYVAAPLHSRVVSLKHSLIPAG